uniref:Uncharacterized protein n=1 Tax=Solibacter usitatus (strain Ellin6076) TaxID=234267 RepID=Q01RX3_SOLUE
MLLTGTPLGVRLSISAVEYGIGGVNLFRPENVPNGQVGFSVTRDGESLVGSNPGDWRPEWVVIGHETACGDPIFVSEEIPHPVFSAMHGQGSWEAKLIAPSLDVLRGCLTVFRRFAGWQKGLRGTRRKSANTGRTVAVPSRHQDANQ